MRLSNIFYTFLAGLAMCGTLAGLSAQSCPGTLIVNEVSNGDSLNREWIEFIAVPSNSCSSFDINIAGIIIDDHNGIYTGGPSSGSGISNGHLRLSDITLFQDFPSGGLLVLYNAEQIDQHTPNTIQNAYNTRNSLGVTIVGTTVFVSVGRDSVIEYNAGAPTFSSGEYCSGNYVLGDTNSWNAISLNNDHDAVEVICPGCTDEVGEPFVFHAFGYDDISNLYAHYNNPVSGFFDGAVYLFNPTVVKADTLRGRQRAFEFFQGTDPGSDANWRAISQSAATPGAFNSAANQNYVALVLADSISVGGCSDTVRVIEPNPEPGDAVLVITEYSNGVSGQNCEYVELFVGFAGSTKPGAVANITGWIVDDNAGTFSTCTSGRGISNGHLRFPNHPLWQSVPYGSKIVLYNPNQNCNGFVSTGTTAPSDSVYFVAVGSDALMEYTGSLPSTASSCQYCTGTYTDPGNYSVIELNNSGDGIQVRCPGCPDEPVFYHGSTYGSSMNGLTSPNLGALDLGSASNSAKTNEFYQNNNVQTLSNWRITTWSSASSNLTAGVVPSAFQTAALAGRLNFPRCGSQLRSEIVAMEEDFSGPVMEVFSIYPNPAADIAYIDLIADNGGTLNIIDMSGRMIQAINVPALQGEMQHISLNLSSMPAGIYMYSMNDGKQNSIQGKFVVSGK